MPQRRLRILLERDAFRRYFSFERRAPCAKRREMPMLDFSLRRRFAAIVMMPPRLPPAMPAHVTLMLLARLIRHIRRAA